MLESLDLLLAFAMLAAILAVMAGAMALILLQHWLLGCASVVGIPVVIIICLETSDWINRAKQRAA